METVILSKKECKSQDKIKYDYRVELNGKFYRVLDWDELEMPIVCDNELFQDIPKVNWSVSNNYARHCGDYLHRAIMRMQENTPPNANHNTVDHINGFTLDNRLANLRFATQSEQNTNRGSRCDKNPPLQQLQDIGVQEYPRHVRWDKTEQKFIIEKHPTLHTEVLQGLRKKPTMSGTKSAKYTIVQKYQDILARLKDLDERYVDKATLAEFAIMKRQLAQEYISITTAIKPNYVPPVENVSGQEDESNMKRSTAPRRKTESTLPDDCGVTVDMLPKYTYYLPEKGVRGDKFSIDIRNPDRYLWSSSGSKKVSTKEKYEEMMNHIASLPVELRSRFDN